ncbi:unnamed protein product [Paramecium pentaurelia]|uniref:CSC1/OSCA1-like cytosolic domain-containing protein n=1 Tax=Paramecium pentaurelia TaxID=43138 RepID=A0A8S1Y4C3_9CILI|nr:unnamed protein product [Paramecium pentaurelia]
MDSQDDEQDFIRNVNLLKSPPNFQQAENHSKAQIIHKEVINDSQRCPCCNLHINSIKYPLLTDLNEFMVHGTAYKFFLFIKINFILLSINFIIAGIYNLFQNFKGDQCIKDETCQQNLYNLLSIFNRVDSENFYDYILDILYIISILIQLAFLRYISHYKNVNYNLDQEIDSELTISVCSVQIFNLFSQLNKTTIMNYFVNYQQDEDEKFNIIDCCLIYNQEHLENQLKIKIREKLVQNNGISLKNVISRFVDQTYILKNREQFLTFSGEVFITLSYEVNIIFLIFKKEAIKFKKAIQNDYLVIECPRPSDVNWSTNKQDYNRKRFFIKQFIACCVQMIFLPVQQAKSEYIMENTGKSGNQQYYNILLSLSIGLLLMLLKKIYFKLTFYEANIFLQKFHSKMIKIVIETLEQFLILLSSILLTLYGKKWDDEVDKRKKKIWCASGFSEDIINIILIDAIAMIILSIIDEVQVWKFIKTIYYKYLNKNSTFTQFESYQLFTKEMNLNKKKFELFIMIGLCSFYGYLYPICYLITLIALFITYWVNKQKVINYGVKEELKFEFYSYKIDIYYTLILQLGSTKIMNAILKLSPLTQPSFYILAFILFILLSLLLQTNWIFQKQIQYYKTKVDLRKSLKHNDLYSKYNPLIDETLWLNEQYEEWEQQYVEGLHLNKSSRQTKFYSALQVKLLREFEKELIPFQKPKYCLLVEYNQVKVFY